MKNILIDNINFQAILRKEENIILISYTIDGQDFYSEYESSDFYIFYHDDEELKRLCQSILKETIEKYNLHLSAGERLGGEVFSHKKTQAQST